MFLEKLDPNWKAAALHGKASQLGMNPKQNESHPSGSVCKCCLNLVYKDPIPLGQNTKQLEFLGFGVPLFFEFFRSCITLLMISVLAYHIISLYWAITHNEEYCAYLEDKFHRRLLAGGGGDPRCWTFMVQFARLEKYVAVEEQILRIAAWVIQFLFLIYTRNSLLKTAQYYDERMTSPGDYAVLLKHLSPQKNIKKKLRIFFETCFKKPYEIKQFTLFSEHEKVEELKSKIMNLNEQLREYYQKENFSDQFQLKKIELQKLTQLMISEAEEQRQKEIKDQLECEDVILVFNYEQIKIDIVETFNDVKKQKRQKMKELFGEDYDKITAQEAPEPVEIIWENIGKSNSSRIKKTILSWIVSLVILGVLTVVIYFILHAKTTLLIESLTSDIDGQTKIAEVNGAIAIVYITILLILFFNKTILSFLFHKLTDFEEAKTGYDYQKSFGLKYCLGLFFTTAIMTLIVEGLESQNFYTYLYGLIDEQSLMFFSTIVFIPVFWLINPFQLFRLFMRWKKHGRRDLTQQEANTLMEDNAYDVGKRYAEIIQIVWFTLLYETLIPLGGFLSLTGLILYYWVDKFNLLRRSVLKINLSYKLPLFFLTVLECSLVMEPAGALVFDGILRQLDTFNLATSIVMISLGLVYIILPKKQIINALYHQKFNLQKKSYTEAKDSFTYTYHSCHPIIRTLNEEKYYKRVKEKKSFETEIILRVCEPKQNSSFGTGHQNSFVELNPKE